MYKISEFAQLGRVSAKMLRHYDEIGLLKPRHIDPATEYRYYSADQLSRLNRIAVLKELGFTLRQIGRLLEERLSADELRGMFAVRQAEAEQRLAAEQQRLAQIGARLALIAQEGGQPHHEVVLRRIEPTLAASRLAVITSEDEVPALLELVERFVRRRKAAAVGPPVVVYHTCEDLELEVQVAVPIAAEIVGNESVQIELLPGAAMACCVVQHHSDLEVSSGYAALARWIEAGGYRVEGANREVYIRGRPGAALSETATRGEGYVMEIQFPVVRGVVTGV